MTKVKSSSLGYPRIGGGREWKKALEAYWSGKINESELYSRLAEVRLASLKIQQEKGIDLIPVNDFTLYDHMLDTAAMFGLVPQRFSSYKGGVVPLDIYYAMARGAEGATACEMTKWFNTNYHYIVPELNGAEPELVENKPLLAYREAKKRLDIEGKPVLVGLFTFLKLSKGYKAEETDAWIDKLLPLYEQVLLQLQQEGVQWVQIDEPILVTTLSEEDLTRVERIYNQLGAAVPGIKILLQTYFESVDAYSRIVQLPVAGIGLDFVHGGEQTLRSLEKEGFPQDKVLGVGLIDGRGIWRADLSAKLGVLERVFKVVAKEQVLIQSSSSLLHVPVSTSYEEKLEPVLKDALAFADEKLDEIILLAKAASEGADAIRTELEQNGQALAALQTSAARSNKTVQAAALQLKQQPAARRESFAERRTAQRERWQLPLLPTTTIGSFPQSPEVRQARAKWRKAEWSDAQYRDFVRQEINRWIRIQEEIGLDVLVHGEFERTDMVEFFGEKLDGFAFTQNGWVQSYGSRCVKPPVIYGDVAYTNAMTVDETVYAQSLTDRPVKGMLTGPVTILNWSFVRDDLSRELVTYQISLALSQEVKALEQAGIGMIQVDEPALREGLPLKKRDHAEYLNWAVDAFRSSTSDVESTTQIHTHMCYCEFNDMVGSIRDLDADVISIETSRSHGELIHSFEEHTYDKGIGLGVYDIHSPRVPSAQEMVSMIHRALRVLDPELFWINPDCGLKTRGSEETIAALRNMVQAASESRESLTVTN
ncbi:5-methyltetrahydropteroyltriglutamate--homocysteine S-methyltransferase [Paenibacillus sp. FJAT-26967]|uniref:5-methyltetrahydropteroyltriglutamate-- homocysteine S-methyltransferase n=1 Tax=Paenibacillus sp. FJAT-26967 TaxID=1729690 RepID=UPI0008384F44|nr:5-methyltetrahydropteroyltriglutamate--homocysteine S-methyltransferase [Paenibacillus sp. FJAT-26967]